MTPDRRTLSTNSRAASNSSAADSPEWTPVAPATVVFSLYSSYNTVACVSCGVAKAPGPIEKPFPLKLVMADILGGYIRLVLNCSAANRNGAFLLGHIRRSKLRKLL